MFLFPRPASRLLAGLAPLVLATPAPAQVTLTCDQPVVTSRVPCVLTAAHGDGKPRTWRWSVLGLEEATQLLEPIAPDRVRVKTPVALVERAFTVVAEDSQCPSATGTFVLRITPNPQAGSGERALVEGLFPGAFTPSLLPFPVPQALGAGEPATVNRIAFCDDAAMGALDRCWILARDTGLEAFKLAGDPVPVPGFPLPAGSGRTCVAVAALPPGPDPVPEGAPRLVFCEHETGAGFGFWIYALEADGRKRLLAGGPGHASVDGPGGDARFSGVVDLALDRRGNVYICQRWDGIRKIGLDGRVVPFGPKDAEWEGPGVRQAECLAVDPATGDLYVGEFDRLVKLAPDGKAAEVIGGGSKALVSSHGSELAPLNPGRVPRGTRFKLGSRQLALRGREVILVGRQGLDAFHLDSRRLERIVAFQPHLLDNRLGPVPYLNPHLGAGRCAAIRGCGPLALTPEAMCLVGLGSDLAELELPDDPLTTVMDPPQAEAKADGGAPAADNLWPGPAVETATVRAGAAWGASHWRSAAPGQRFTGQCRVAARGLTAGLVRIELMFADAHGRTLVEPKPAGPRESGVCAPAQGQPPLRATRTAPAGTDRVAFCLQVIGGNPGAEVSFREVTFQQLP